MTSDTSSHLQNISLKESLLHQTWIWLECLWGPCSCPESSIIWLSFGLSFGSNFYVSSLSRAQHSLGFAELALLHCFFLFLILYFFFCHPFISVVDDWSFSSVFLYRDRVLWRYILQWKRLELLLDLTAEIIIQLGVTEDLRLISYSACLFSMPLREKWNKQTCWPWIPHVINFWNLK